MKTPFRCLSENRRNTLLVYLVCLTPLALLDIETQNTGVNFGVHLRHLEYKEKNWSLYVELPQEQYTQKTK